jgi:hypothetical protein
MKKIAKLRASKVKQNITIIKHLKEGPFRDYRNEIFDYCLLSDVSLSGSSTVKT